MEVPVKFRIMDLAGETVKVTSMMAQVTRLGSIEECRVWALLEMAVN